jgi:hypothetical protein
MSSSSSNTGPGERSDTTCFYCGKKGHIKADCRKRQHDLQHKRTTLHAEAHVALVASDSSSSSTTTAHTADSSSSSTHNSSTTDC